MLNSIGNATYAFNVTRAYDSNLDFKAAWLELMTELPRDHRHAVKMAWVAYDFLLHHHEQGVPDDVAAAGFGLAMCDTAPILTEKSHALMQRVFALTKVLYHCQAPTSWEAAMTGSPDCRACQRLRNYYQAKADLPVVDETNQGPSL